MTRALTLVLLAITSAPALAQSWPAKPIRLVVPFPAGGSGDVMGRITAQRLGTLYGQTLIVENRPGAGGHVGAEVVARVPGDGYTLMLGTIGIHAAHSIYRKLGYNPTKDLQPVMLLSEMPNALVLHPSVPARSVREFVALAKQRPGQLNFGSAGPGSSTHMIGELFLLVAQVKLTHVPYKGSAPAMADLLGGQIHLMFENLPGALAHIQSGRLRCLGVTSAQRSPSLPDVPTVAESGVPEYSATAWFTISTVATVPAPLVERINTDLRKVMGAPEALEDLRKLGVAFMGGTPAQASQFFAAETVKWTRVIDAAGIRLD